MIKRICLLTNFNLYESKRYFTQKLAEALGRRDIEVMVLDVYQEALEAIDVRTLIQFAPDVACSFNSFPPISQGKFLWDLLEIPYLSLLVDPSYYSSMLTDSPYSILSCVDRSDCEAILSSGFKNVFFLPHAVEKELASGNEERPYEVVLLGSCYDYESMRKNWQQILPKAVSQMLEDAITIVFSEETLSLAQALVKALNASKLKPQDVDFLKLYSYLDYYTRGKDRIELVRSIKEAQVHIFGEMDKDNFAGVHGWDYYFASQANVTVHAAVPFSEAMNILKGAKIVLNSMPFFRDGSHERIFTALACGCLPVSSESMYLREQFKAGEEIIFYQASKRAEVNSYINDLLGNEKKRRMAALHGSQKVRQRHTWDNRVETLLEELPKMLQRIPKKNKLA